MTLRSTEEAAQHSASAEARQHELGQFFTAAPIADFMASWFNVPFREIHLLDAGAGMGALSAAMV